MLEDYLNHLNEELENEDACGFAIDSFPTKASKRPLPVAYPNTESIDLDTNFDFDKPRIMIDFDQVIHKYSVGWTEGIIYDDPIQGVKEAIDMFKNEGYEVIIFTTRLSEKAQGIGVEHGVEEQRMMIEEWLEKHNIEVDGMTAEKLPATLYIDDRAYRFEGKWDKKTISEIKQKLKEDLKEY